MDKPESAVTVGKSESAVKVYILHYDCNYVRNYDRNFVRNYDQERPSRAFVFIPVTSPLIFLTLNVIVL